MQRAKEAALTPDPSPAQRARGDPQGRRESSTRSAALVRDAARRMRKAPTRSESFLWYALRNRRLAGLKFRRQHAIGRFVLDFYCRDKRLAVEIDGPVHGAQRGADEERQRILESMGVRFLRLPATLVEQDLSAALAAIQESLSFVPSPATRERGDSQSRGEGS